MKRLHITAEGQTEELFINNSIKHHLAQHNVFADVRCVLTGRNGAREFRGGMTNYSKAKNDIIKWLKEEQNNSDVVFTTMFDYYALPPDFPGYDDALRKSDPYDKVNIIEAAFKSDIADRRFIPYIQLHEFETLLFADVQKFEIEFLENVKGIEELKSIIIDIHNPELINQGAETAPSKRIIKVFPRYKNNKTTIGPMIAKEIGIDKLKASCCHFNDWLTRLEQLG